MFKLTFILFTLLLLCCKKTSDDAPKDKAAETQDSASAQVAFWDTVSIKDLVSLLGTSVDSLPEIKGYKKEKKKLKIFYLMV